MSKKINNTHEMLMKKALKEASKLLKKHGIIDSLIPIKQTRNSSGLYHSYDDKPSIEWSDGLKFWHKNGELHREEDKPATEWGNGIKECYKNGKLYKDNKGPDYEL